MVPEDALSKPIAELPVGLSHMGYSYIDNRCRRIIADLEQELGYKADTATLGELIQYKEALEKSELGFAEKDAKRKELFAAMEKVMQTHIGKAYSQNMGKDDVTLRDVMTRYLPDEMPVYNSEGFPLDLAKNAS